MPTLPENLVETYNTVYDDASRVSRERNAKEFVEVQRFDPKVVNPDLNRREPQQNRQAQQQVQQRTAQDRIEEQKTQEQRRRADPRNNRALQARGAAAAQGAAINRNQPRQGAAAPTQPQSANQRGPVRSGPLVPSQMRTFVQQGSFSQAGSQQANAPRQGSIGSLIARNPGSPSGQGSFVLSAATPAEIRAALAGGPGFIFRGSDLQTPSTTFRPLPQQRLANAPGGLLQTGRPVPFRPNLTPQQTRAVGLSPAQINAAMGGLQGGQPGQLLSRVIPSAVNRVVDYFRQNPNGQPIIIPGHRFEYANSAAPQTPASAAMARQATQRRGNAGSASKETISKGGVRSAQGNPSGIGNPSRSRSFIPVQAVKRNVSEGRGDIFWQASRSEAPSSSRSQPQPIFVPSPASVIVNRNSPQSPVNSLLLRASREMKEANEAARGEPRAPSRGTTISRPVRNGPFTPVQATGRSLAS